MPKPSLAMMPHLLSAPPIPAPGTAGHHHRPLKGDEQDPAVRTRNSGDSVEETISGLGDSTLELAVGAPPAVLAVTVHRRVVSRVVWRRRVAADAPPHAPHRRVAVLCEKEGRDASIKGRDCENKRKNKAKAKAERVRQARGRELGQAAGMKDGDDDDDDKDNSSSSSSKTTGLQFLNTSLEAVSPFFFGFPHQTRRRVRRSQCHTCTGRARRAAGKAALVRPAAQRVSQESCLPRSGLQSANRALVPPTPHPPTSPET